ncbi:hypothetical protein Dsin_032954 [Dipteronia sinensis]|uniref:Uncharacterized protein n=1 Tax=Dipteronia sinensis TaxID=43782 RepID=A0AAD9Z9U8_9ROSI|nr:hypothetical protein Dsin_032954 [Dipteronia sinensis]
MSTGCVILTLMQSTLMMEYSISYGVQPLLDGVLSYLPCSIEVSNYALDQRKNVEKVMLAGNPNETLVALPFKLEEGCFGHLTYLSALMDCVGCEKCRLWGNLQMNTDDDHQPNSSLFLLETAGGYQNYCCASPNMHLTTKISSIACDLSSFLNPCSSLWLEGYADGAWLINHSILTSRLMACKALCAQRNSEGHVDAWNMADSDTFLFGAKCLIKSDSPNSKAVSRLNGDHQYIWKKMEIGSIVKAMHEITFSTDNKPKLLSQETELLKAALEKKQGDQVIAHHLLQVSLRKQVSKAILIMWKYLMMGLMSERLIQNI